MVTPGRTRSTALTETEIRDVFADATRGWKPRPEQLRLLADLAKSKARLILVEAPTGIGKSALAVVYGKLLGEQTTILTATKSLQNQYERDFDVVKMMGRPNYKCEVNGLSAAEGQCQIEAVCCGGGYYQMRSAASQARCVVANYSAYLYDLMYGSLPFAPGLLVADEGHLLLNHLTEFEAGTLESALARRLGIPVDGWASLGEARSWARAHSESIAERRRQAIKSRDPRTRDWTKLYWQVATILSRENDWVTLKTGPTIKVAPLWPRRSARRLLNSSKRMLIMSATLYGGETLAQLLGYDDMDYDYFTVPSPFSPERFQISFDPYGWPSNKKPEEWIKIAEGVHDGIHLPEFRGMKGIVHVPARAHVEKALTRVRRCPECSNRVITPSESEKREDTIRRFKESPSGTWLCHYSVGIGEDFPDDLCSVQIIAKVPYPDLSDELTRRRMEDPKIGQKMYVAMTAAAVAQIVGRCMRHVDNECVVLIIDGNFGRMWSQNRDLFPPWFEKFCECDS